MLAKSEIKALLKRIEHSKSFGSNSTYSLLLRYLVECTLSEIVPKEHAIAEHIFGTKIAETDTSKVRVYIYNLRKKLQQYFENEGKKENYLLSIPKGRYKVQFRKNKSNTILTFLNPKAGYLWPILTVLLLCSLVANIYLVLQSNNHNQKVVTESIFWKDFFDSDKQSQVIIGDLYIFSEFDSLTGESINLRIPEINTPSQFKAYKKLKENEGKNMQEMTYSHISNKSMEWIIDLTKTFYQKKKFTIRTQSSVEAEDLIDYNIVFVGTQKTAGIFNTYFDHCKFDYNLTQPYQYRLKTGNDELTFQPSGNPDSKHIDYGFIAKYPGPNDNTIFMLSGIWESGTSESLRNFLQASKVHEMEEIMKSRLGHIPQYFEMLIEVEGIDRIGFESKVLLLNEIRQSNE